MTDERLAQYASALRASPHNLLSSRALAELERRHLPESEALAARLPKGPATLVDVGSGGGLPGVVIALTRPDLSVTLIEATAKKAAFLREVTRDLGLDVVVHTGRAEELGRGDLAGRFDLATARAVAPLARLVPWCLPLLRPGGRLYAIKGDRWAEEVAQARPMLRACGGEVVATPDDEKGRDAGELAPRLVIIARVR